MLNRTSVCSLTNKRVQSDAWVACSKAQFGGQILCRSRLDFNRLAFIPLILFPSVGEKAASGSEGGAATNARCSEKKQRQVVSSWGIKKERNKRSPDVNALSLECRGIPYFGTFCILSSTNNVPFVPPGKKTRQRSRDFQELLFGGLIGGEPLSLSGISVRFPLPAHRWSVHP